MMLGRCACTYAYSLAIALFAWSLVQSSCERRAPSLLNLAITAQESRAKDRERDEHVYRVLSYNICWGCMEADTHDATGMRGIRKEACLVFSDTPGVTGPNGIGQNITQCALNMGQELAKFYDAIGGYDLIGLQEASNAGDLLQVATLDSPTMAKMKLVEYGEPLPGLTASKGIHKGEQKYAWIAAMYDKDRLGEHNVLVTSKEMETSLEQSFLEQPSRKEYRIIMTGDFNDFIAVLPGCLEFPWAPGQMGIQKPLVKSGGGGGRATGDYVFDSASTPKNELPMGYNTTLPQSDHWPVQAILSPQADKQANGGFKCVLLRKVTR